MTPSRTPHPAIVTGSSIVSSTGATSGTNTKSDVSIPIAQTAMTYVIR